MRAIASLAAVALMTVSASAHDTYMLARDWTPDDINSVILDLTSSGGFPVLEYGPAPDRITVMSAHIGGGDVVVSTGERDEARSLPIEAAPGRTGTLHVALSFGPRPITLTPDSLEHYLEEIGASDAVRAAAAALGDQPFEEVYTKHSQSVLCVIECDVAPEPAGLDLEFVLEAGSPTRPTTVRLLYKGAPAADLHVNLKTADGEVRALRTDASGRFELPELPEGPTLLSAVRLMAPASDGAPFTSDFGALTFNAAD